MAAFSEEIVEIKCDPHKILNNTYLYRFFCSKFKSIVDFDVPLYTSRRSPLSLSEVKFTKLGENRLKSGMLWSTSLI